MHFSYFIQNVDKILQRKQTSPLTQSALCKEIHKKAKILYLRASYRTCKNIAIKSSNYRYRTLLNDKLKVVGLNGALGIVVNVLINHESSVLSSKMVVSHA
jgi:hypothetical protein